MKNPYAADDDDDDYYYCYYYWSCYKYVLRIATNKVIREVIIVSSLINIMITVNFYLQLTTFRANKRLVCFPVCYRS